MTITKSPREAFGAQMFRRGEHDVPQDHSDATLDEGGQGCIDCGARWEWRDRFGAILYCEACYRAEESENEQIAALVPERLAEAARAMQVKPPPVAVRDAVVVIIPKPGPDIDVYAAIEHATRGGYELPGGKVEPHETHEDAARREVREEVGVELMDLVGVPGTDVTHMVGTVRWCVKWFIGTVSPDVVLRGSAEGKACWATREALLCGTFSGAVGQIFDGYDTHRDPTRAS